MITNYPEKVKKRHNFPFIGFLTCDECGKAITAQYAHGNDGKYATTDVQRSLANAFRDTCALTCLLPSLKRS